MNLKIRYDDKYQTLTLDTEATGQLWVSLGLTDEGLTQEEREKLIQEKVEEVYNRPDYNNWHQYWRHQGESKAQPDNEGEGVDSPEPLISEVVDDRIFRKEEIERERKDSYDAVCQWIFKILKPDVAEAFIATKIDRIAIRDYVIERAKPGDDIKKLENNLSKKLARAAQKLAIAYSGKDF